AALRPGGGLSAAAEDGRGDRGVPGRGAEEPAVGQGVLRHGPSLLAGQEDRGGEGGVREVLEVRHQRGRGLPEGCRGTPQDAEVAFFALTSLLACRVPGSSATSPVVSIVSSDRSS